MSDLTTVDFHGAKLVALKGASPADTLVAMKPVVEGMGLTWQVQHRKLMAHPVLSKGITEMVMPSQGGEQRMVALPLSRLNFWLATIHTNKIEDADLRAKVIEYQEECADVLFAHFFAKAGGALDETTRRMDGINRMLAKKVTGMEKMVTQIVRTLESHERRMAEHRELLDGRVAALSLISVRQLMDEAGAVSKGRNSLNRRVRNALMKLAATGNVKGVTDCPHTGVALFPIDFAREFMRTTGNGWVRQHNAVQTGQGVIKFPARRRRPVSNQPAV